MAYTIVVYTITEGGQYEFMDALSDASWMAASAFIEDHASENDIVSVTVLQGSRVISKVC